ncbi:hypothetical protein [Xanthomonas sp. XNM01]|uniref:hypothetical protein n=1 Tax=Xanthomonas sp. XNM01 TaxID=2769289 RepID=UPI00177E753B|nr:hypothetical protein [Xanthomonas sp. XNM01]
MSAARIGFVGNLLQSDVVPADGVFGRQRHTLVAGNACTGQDDPAEVPGPLDEQERAFSPMRVSMPRSTGIEKVVERVIARLGEIEQIYGAGVREQQSRVFLAELQAECDGPAIHMEVCFQTAYRARFGD